MNATDVGYITVGAVVGAVVLHMVATYATRLLDRTASALSDKWKTARAKQSAADAEFTSRMVQDDELLANTFEDEMRARLRICAMLAMGALLAAVVVHVSDRDPVFVVLNSGARFLVMFCVVFALHQQTRAAKRAQQIRIARQMRRAAKGLTA